MAKSSQNRQNREKQPSPQNNINAKNRIAHQVLQLGAQHQRLPQLHVGARGVPVDVRVGHAQRPAAGAAFEAAHDGHVVAHEPAHGLAPLALRVAVEPVGRLVELDGEALLQLEARAVVEHGAAVHVVRVAGAAGARLLLEDAQVAQRHGVLQEEAVVRVLHLLQADEVAAVARELGQDEREAVAPVEEALLHVGICLGLGVDVGEHVVGHHLRVGLGFVGLGL